MNYIINQAVAEAVISYLAKRPWAEVNALMAGLHGVLQSPVPDETKEPKAKA